MSKKTTTGFNIDKSMSQVSKTSVFDRIIKEIDADEIPTRYIEHILVQYQDGNVVELSGEELTMPVPLSRTADWERLDESFKRMRDVRVFINTERLEKDINAMVERLLGRHC